MAKRPSPRVLASLFDTASYHGPSLPKELLLAWATSSREEDVAEALLHEYKVPGTCVLGDASGLSKLSRTLPLTDVLALLHHPKSIVASLGKRYGGVPVGGWTADNTGMWFGQEVHPKKVYTYAANLLASLAPLPFAMSFALHAGFYYRIGSALIGPAYHTLEAIAENDVPAGELWATLPSLPYLGVTGSRRHGPHGEMVSLPLTGTAEMTFLEARESYPHSFSPGFARMLDVYARSDEQEKAVLRASMEQDVHREGYVLFWAYELPSQHTLAGVLDAQELDTYLVSSCRQAKHAGGATWVKMGGGIGIVVAATLEAALAEAQTLGGVFAAAEVPVSMGVDRGGFFLFVQEDGDMDVAGSPVNIASKLSEDCGRPGCVLVSEGAGSVLSRATHRISVSGLSIVAQEHALSLVS